MKKVAVKAKSKKAVTSPKGFWVLTLQTAIGTNVWTGPSRDALINRLYDFCKDNWSDTRSEGKCPDIHRDDLISAYFERTEDTLYSIEQIKDVNHNVVQQIVHCPRRHTLFMKKDGQIIELKHDSDGNPYYTVYKGLSSEDVQSEMAARKFAAMLCRALSNMNPESGNSDLAVERTNPHLTVTRDSESNVATYVKAG
jgi:hypothetical protein